MKQQSKKKKLQTRINVFFFIVFIIFSTLILRLGYVQIVYGESYKKEVEQTEEISVSTSVPRGRMLDRQYNVVVDNSPTKAITYTRSYSTSQEERLEIAEDLAQVLSVETDKITERDMKDYWIITRPEEAKAILTEEDYLNVEEGNIEEDVLYQLQLERITNEELGMISEQELNVLAIKREMDSGYALTPQIIKKGVTDVEFAYISEHLDVLPGVDVTTDWDREYVYEDLLRTLIGNITTSDEGLPADSIDYYLSKGYSRNDRVGKSYLELQYEDILQGEKKKIKNITDKVGNVVDVEVLSEGAAGKDIILTIDMELQQEVERIIEQQLTETKKQSGTELLDRAFVIIMNPRNGEILTMAGKQMTDDNEIKDFALGGMTTSYEMGSTVKGATVLAGFQEGVIQPNTVLYDTPIKIKGTPEKSSWKNMGYINDLVALKQSSNVYMFRTAIAIGNGVYVPNQSLRIDNDALSTMRYYFNQFGLGISTGIDLPNESTGVVGENNDFLLDYAIGQYDTYTALQMAQYVSTIANGGYRMKPHLVKEVRQPSSEKELGPVDYSINPVVLNQLDMNQEFIERVQEGFRQVTQESGGTAYTYFNNKEYDVSGKTGTAETYYYGPKENYQGMPTYNLTFVGYSPSENPEIAFSVVVPWADTRNKVTINKQIAAQVTDAYYELKNERIEESE
ncbi:penicillin-binding protein 2 [Bacillus carboniphilus]|uniref:serine-type D-Ala-D-Ala carboxypeptidase n=1 Tax=Bacillus carboniphilus TaxID=86663 RepID=A0ABY9K032_9BACI|nr:penicillin-binding protein 2 [Bacillus carboniphilus]WLR43953.1 penicillin-binding protein 2 [Bacillus carboniphilus]